MTLLCIYLVSFLLYRISIFQFQKSKGQGQYTWSLTGGFLEILNNKPKNIFRGFGHLIE